MTEERQKEMPEEIAVTYYDGYIIWEGHVPDDMKELQLVKYIRKDLTIPPEVIEIIARGIDAANKLCWSLTSDECDDSTAIDVRNALNSIAPYRKEKL